MDVNTDRKLKVTTKQSEHAVQVAVFEWAGYARVQYPELGMLFAIPNGGSRHRVVGAKLKAEGVKKGVPDICLPVPRGMFHGLFIEMKAGLGKPSPDQEEWLRLLRQQGYEALICRGAHGATEAIQRYLSIRGERAQRPHR